ncbi:targeting protein for Xklp2-like isoform X2 [Cimex lectularius]|uniref:TPX2 central domain-containing protein n=1 Tax=Cimex lectularius TaxID=79782 RepID=A0A8I6TLG4_CIMLE|nr:targeting protein for Xklp2-like isoform X2 [Cimex lectularius]
MDPFEYQAPKFVERLQEKAENLENDGADEFFDIPELNSFTDTKENPVFLTPKQKQELKEQFFTPLPLVKGSPVKVLSNKTNEQAPTHKTPGKHPKGPRPIIKAKRRVSNVNKKAESNTEGLKNLTFRKEKIKLDSVPPEKQHSMITRHDVFKSLRKGVINKEAVKRKGSPINYGGKHMTLAEHLFHFQNDTPPRFKSKSIRSSAIPLERTRLTLTMAHSPQLATKHRTRAHPVPSRVDNNLVKAHPVNKNIFKPPVMNRPPPRPSTMPVPFKLTEVKTKASHKTMPEPFHFKARPAPKPSKNNENNEIFESNLFKGLKLVTGGKKVTEVKPFSFDERNKKKQLEKEEKIKKIIDEESKIPKFHAKPPPSTQMRRA